MMKVLDEDAVAACARSFAVQLHDANRLTLHQVVVHHQGGGIGCGSREEKTVKNKKKMKIFFF